MNRVRVDCTRHPFLSRGGGADAMDYQEEKGRGGKGGEGEYFAG